MAALPVIADVCRVVITGTTPSGTLWANIIHFRNDTGGSMAAAITTFDADLQDFLDKSAYGGGFGIGHWTHTGWLSALARYTPLDGMTAATTKTAVHDGAGTGDALPPDVAVVLSWQTALRGPRYRGRTYIAGFGEGTCTASGRVDAAAVAGLAASGGKFITDLAVQNTPLVVASYKFATAEDIVGCSVNDTFDRQERRRH
jgi:hypothetical protein